jgi:hypothetical protein
MPDFSTEAELDTYIATLDPALIETTRQHSPFLRDRRIDAQASSPHPPQIPISGADGEQYRKLDPICG